MWTPSTRSISRVASARIQRTGSNPYRRPTGRRGRSSSRHGCRSDLPQARCFAIMRDGRLRLPLGHQQVRQKLVGVCEFRVDTQGRLQLLFSLVKVTGPPKGHGEVVARWGIVRAEPQRGLEVVTRFFEIARPGEKVGQVV